MSNYFSIFGPAEYSRLIFLIVGVIVIFSMWRIFEKAGKPGWAAIIPIYNLIVLLKIAGQSPWLVILLFIPIINWIVLFILSMGLATAFNKSVLFALGLFFFPYIFYPILAFGDAEYVG